MNKLHSIALFTMLTPAITLSSGLALAQQTSGQNLERDQQTQHQSSQGAQHSGQSDNQSAAARLAADGRNDMEHRGFMDAAPTNGMHISNLMEAEVKTSNDEEVGSVNDLIVDEDGQIVAIVIGVGGFLGMGEKDVAIGWDDVTMGRDSDNRRSATGTTATTSSTDRTVTGSSDDYDLRISMTREELRSAPEFERNE
ncbi:MAG: PRC-barrel domain-containing protein [Pseudohongiella sp.]|uniref:PRC-barrel domain-containing protein n=1 Tax=Pseudohongiella sp. TaxID=1979412 RepID=UPI0034A041E9